MSVAQDDPRLTAYALGELTPEEMQTFRAELAEDARARTEVLALRELGARLERELQSGPAPRLSTAQRERIFAALEQPATATGPSPGSSSVAPEAPPAVEHPTAPAANSEAQRSAPSRAPRLRWRTVMLAAALLPGLGTIVVMLSSEPAPDEFEPSSLATSRQDSAPANPSAVPKMALTGSPSGVSGLRQNVEMGPPRAKRHVQRALDNMRGGPEPEPELEAEASLSEVFSDEKGGGLPELRAAVPGNRAERERAARRVPEYRAAEERGAAQGNREGYDAVSDNQFLRVATEPRSTFSIDVDTASYALVRRFLTSGSLPPRGAVRIEELINYFSYRYPEPSGDEPFSVVANLSQAPWAPAHQLVRIALQARHVAQGARPPANLVFLIDVSGSMNDANKLDLVKHGLRRLTESLGARDRVAIVVYAGASGLVLPATSGNRKGEIQQALAQLEAGGSTNGGQGIELAYSLAAKNFIRGGVNRVLLATDGDFNVGVTSQSELVELVQRKAKTGVFLSVLGFGAGNYQDSMLEKLADRGNGNYAYVDDAAEAEKVLVEQASGTLVTVAKDVKLQLEFNPAEVAAFRLLGYENRLLQHQDFNDDSKDAGEIGAGHSVTALYEVIPAGGTVPSAEVDPLKYQTPAPAPASPPGGAAQARGEWLNIKLRYQPPEGGASRLKELALSGPVTAMNEDFRFAAALAEFGMLLRQSPHRGQANYEQVLQLAQSSLGDGKDRRLREQFIELVRSAHRLAGVEGSAGTPRPFDPLNGSLP